MPYINQARRSEIHDDTGAENSGELNYSITLEIIKYLKNKGLCYQTINDIVGALEGAKAEFYRRVAIPYEDQKIKSNGDVYD